MTRYTSKIKSFLRNLVRDVLPISTSIKEFVDEYNNTYHYINNIKDDIVKGIFIRIIRGELKIEESSFFDDMFKITGNLIKDGNNILLFVNAHYTSILINTERHCVSPHDSKIIVRYLTEVGCGEQFKKIKRNNDFKESLKVSGNYNQKEESNEIKKAVLKNVPRTNSGMGN